MPSGIAWATGALIAATANPSATSLIVNRFLRLIAVPPPFVPP